MSHYFVNDPNLRSEEKTYLVNIFNRDFKFISDNGVFSGDKLDYGTRLLLNNLNIDDKVNSILDVGTGIGVIGIILKSVYPNTLVSAVDVNLRAIDLAIKNAKLNACDVTIFESNLYERINTKFDLIVSNPPIRAGKKVLYKLYQDSINYLNKDGSLIIVIRKQHGAKSTLSYLETLFKSVTVVTKDKGFFIIKSKN